MGSNVGFLNTLKRINLGLKGQYKFWHECNRHHLYSFKKYKHSKDSQMIVNDFYNLREMKFSRIKNLRKQRVYRQTLQGQIMLYLATIIYRI